MGFFDVFKAKVKVHVKHDAHFPGNVVEGYCEVIASGEIEFVGIRVVALGEEHIVCKRQEGHGKRRRTRTYTETVTIFKQQLTLAGELESSGSRTKRTLPQGQYTYPFAIQLPSELPPSFAKRVTDDSADIKYSVQAYVDIPNGIDVDDKKFFSVLTAMPATQWQMPNPVTVDRAWDVTCCCCIGKGRVKARLWMDRTLIAMNRDKFLVCADIDNTEGENPVDSIEFSLINLLSYTANGVTERNSQRVAHQIVATQKVEPGQKGRINGEVAIPRNFIPTVTTWNVKSSYKASVELNIPMASDPAHSFDVIVTQCVDDTNTLPPVDFGTCRFRKQVMQEYFYQPPPRPVFAFNPIPLPPPANVPMWQPQPPVFAALPPQAFAAPTAYGAEFAAGGGNVQWQQGYEQNHLAAQPLGGAPPVGHVPPPQQQQPMHQPAQQHQHQQAPPPGGLVGGSVYELVPRHVEGASRLIDVAGGGSEAGAELHLWDALGAPNQRFRYIDVGGGWFALFPTHAETLAVQAGDGDGGVYTLQPQNPQDLRQQWRAQPTDSGFFTVVSRADESKCIDCSGAGQDNGTKITVWGQIPGAPQQQFMFRQVQ